MRWGFIVSVAAMLCILVSVPGAAAEAESGHHLLPPRIVVVGEGKAYAKPDLAAIQVGVVTQAQTAADAVQQNNVAMRKLIDTLKSNNIADDDMQTSGFNVSPRYQHDGREAPRITAYEVNNQVSVKVRQLTELGGILDDVVQSGANRIHGIHFTIDEPSAVLDRARQEAVADAARKARIYANTAGVKVGRPLAIEEITADQPQPMYGRRMAMAEMASDVPIATGEQTLRATIQITYELQSDE